MAAEVCVCVFFGREGRGAGAIGVPDNNTGTGNILPHHLQTTAVSRRYM